MPAPRQGDPLCPTGAVVLRGRRGVLDRERPGCSWHPGLCTWCGRDVKPGGRRTLWCSAACVDAFKATTPAGQLAALEARDHGRCRLCGLDTERLREAVRRWMQVFGLDRGATPRMPRGRPGPPIYPQRQGAQRDLAQVLTLRGLSTSERALGHLLGTRQVWWDGDHVIPIVDGGHPCDLRNLRTLCWWCHQRETAEAATRRAERRRGLPEPTDQVPLFAPKSPPC